MKHLCMYAAALVMGGFLVAYVGCDGKPNLAKDDYDAEKIKQQEAIMRSKADIEGQRTEQLNVELKSRLTNEINKTKQLIEEFDQKDALPKLKIHLAEIKNERDRLEQSAKKYEVDALSALDKMKRHEKEEMKYRNAYTMFKDDVGAKPEDLEQTFQVGQRTYTGKEIMNILKDYKDKAFKESQEAANAKANSDHCKQFAEDLRLNWIPVYDDVIRNTNTTILDYERLVGFRDDTMGGSLDGVVTLQSKIKGELERVQKEVDDMNNHIKLASSAAKSEATLIDYASERNSYKITDNDW